MNVLLWRLKSLTGDRDLRRYWIYCLAMAALCWICWDLDGGGVIPLIAAVFSTPMGPVGALTAVLMNGARYETCCGACLTFCPAETLYHHWLLRRHRAERAKRET